MKIAMLLGRVCVFVLCMGVNSGRVMASAVELDLAPFAKGTHLITLGRYEQAAEQWHRLSLAFLSAEAQLGRKKMWQYAGMSAALAAMAADKANSALAYQYWADSTRYLMTGGTDWPQVQKRMHRRFEQANTLLSTQVQVADVVSSVDHAWQQELSLLQVWDDKLTLFRFASPQLGLRETGGGLSPAVSLGGGESLSAQPRYIRPVASATGKKLSGINSTFSYEKRRPTTVPITGPDEAISESLTSENKHVSSSAKTPHTASTDKQPELKAEAKFDLNPTPNVVVTPVKPIVFNESNLKLNLKSNPNPRTTGPRSPIPRNDAPESQTPVAHTPENQKVLLMNTEHVTSALVEPVKVTEKKEVARGVVSRGNLETVEEAGVEAIRRRSFAPIGQHLPATADDASAMDENVQ